MKNTFLLIAIVLSLTAGSQQTTTVKIPPSKDTTIVKFITTTTTTSNTQTSYTTSTVPGDTIVVPPVQPPPTTPKKFEGFGAAAISALNQTNIQSVASKADFESKLGSNRILRFTRSVSFSGRYYFNYSNLVVDANGFDVTIDNAGNGDGISIESGTNVILIGLRVINAGNDGINVTGGSNIIIANCSSYGNGDGNIDIAGGSKVTVQDCILGRNSGSGLMLITSQNVSVHHNLFAGGSSGEGSERNPYAHNNYTPVGTPPNFDFRNNVITSSGRYASGNGYKAVGNYINNYYTSTKEGLINLCADSKSCGTAYVSGNFNQPTASGGTKVSSPYSIPAQYQVTTQTAQEAKTRVKSSVGPAVKNSYELGLINAIP